MEVSHQEELVLLDDFARCSFGLVLQGISQLFIKLSFREIADLKHRLCHSQKVILEEMFGQLVTLLGLGFQDIFDFDPPLSIDSMVLVHVLYAEGQLVYGLLLFFSLSGQELPQYFRLYWLSMSLSQEGTRFS